MSDSKELSTTAEGLPGPANRMEASATQTTPTGNTSDGDTVNMSIPNPIVNVDMTPNTIQDHLPNTQPSPARENVEHNSAALIAPRRSTRPRKPRKLIVMNMQGQYHG